MGKIHSLPMKAIRIQDKFWGKYMEKVRQEVIPYQWKALNDLIEDAEPSYCIRNFKIAAGRLDGDFKGMVFQDSDVYKWLEAVAYSLIWHPDKELEKLADGTIELIEAAQQDDGYLDTYYIINGLENRLTNLTNNHELYCLGHMIEAAVAYTEATGKRRFLEVAIRYVDCIDKLIGPEEGKLHGYPGHEIIEMALMRLYHLTREERFLKMATYFVDQRGKSPNYFEEEDKREGRKNYFEGSYMGYRYFQAERPVREQMVAEGHAVRAVYYYSGVADVAMETKDEELIETCQRLWDNIERKQMYITGGIGSSVYGEAFTFDYDLPNDTAYAETCASIGLCFLARRMFELTGQARYMNVLERALYNGVISGMSLDGKRFFYVNPLEVFPEASLKDHTKEHVKVERQKWFACACCPPNLARMIASLSSYAYQADEEGFYINLYLGSTINTSFAEKKVQMTTRTAYPWNNGLQVDIEPESPVTFTLKFRIPEWTKAYKIRVNGHEVDSLVCQGFAQVKREWSSKDSVSISFDMEPTFIEANPNVREDIGKVALQYGPLIYCLEEHDNGKQLHQLKADTKDRVEAIYDKGLLDGLMILTSQGARLVNEDWEDKLYRPVQKGLEEKTLLTWIPYYSWANRGPGEMSVWVRKLGSD